MKKSEQDDIQATKFRHALRVVRLKPGFPEAQKDALAALEYAPQEIILTICRAIRRA